MFDTTSFNEMLKKKCLFVPFFGGGVGGEGCTGFFCLLCVFLSLLLIFGFSFFKRKGNCIGSLWKWFIFFFNWNSQNYWDRPLNTLRMDREFCTERGVSACFCLSENTFSLEEFFDEQKYYLLLYWDEEEYMWCCHWSENSY